MQFRNDIQGLRALAVILVFIFHLNQNWLPGGFIGVDIFFVISGYIVSLIILDKKDKGSFSVIDFFKSRVKRIIPAYLVVLILCCILASFIFFSKDFNAFRKSLIWSTFFYSNNYFSDLDTYFGAGLSEMPLLHTWSLAIEMQFYLILPIFLYFIPNRYHAKIVLFITIILTTYASYEIFVNHNQSQIYFSLPARIPEFCIGILFCLISRSNFSFSPKNETLIAIFSIVTIGVSCILINEESPFPGILSFIPCLAVGVLLICQRNPITFFLSNKPLAFVGEISYSIYLWHWPIMAFFRYYYANYTFSTVQIIYIIILTIFFSVTSYYIIEKRLRSKRDISFSLNVIPLFLILFGAYRLSFPIQREFKQIPEEYIKPTFGIKSHSKPFIETFGDTTVKPLIYLTGDSHALCLKPTLDYIGKRNNFSFRTLTTNVFIPIEGLNSDEILHRNINAFRIATELMPITNNEIGKAKIIILHSNNWNAVPSLMTALETLILNLKDDQQVILLNGFPTFEIHPVKISRSHIKNKTNYLVENKMTFQQPNEQFLKLLDNPQVHYFDIPQYYSFIEAPFHNDTLMYYDKTHLNVFGSLVVGKSIEKDFMEFLNPIFHKVDSINSVKRLN